MKQLSMTLQGSEEDRKEIAQIIYDESLRMGRLVNDLLDLARMESGHTGLHYEKINVNEFLEKIIRKFSGVAKEKILLYIMTFLSQKRNLCLMKTRWSRYLPI